MLCTGNTHRMDEPQNALSPSVIPEEEKRRSTKTSSRDDELSVKVDLWRTLTN